ncbi:MAG: hypothetical protein HYZ36_02290 [Pedosphaera parvula]|nr:hypothetical protein [Pedosphaera parvula]
MQKIIRARAKKASLKVKTVFHPLSAPHLSPSATQTIYSFLNHSETSIPNQ